FAVQGQIEMAKKKVTLKQLKACVAGGVLPIELNEAALFNLAHKQIFKGQVVEQETGLAFQITQLSNNTTSN
ncbi:FliM/FliN family flagellar motor switch protein, partial [Psychrobacter sp. SIMBA_152]